MFHHAIQSNIHYDVQHLLSRHVLSLQLHAAIAFSKFSGIISTFYSWDEQIYNLLVWNFFGILSTKITEITVFDVVIKKCVTFMKHDVMIILMHGAQRYEYSVLHKGTKTVAACQTVQHWQENNAMLNQLRRQKFQTLQHLSELLAAAWLWAIRCWAY